MKEFLKSAFSHNSNPSHKRVLSAFALIVAIILTFTGYPVIVINMFIYYSAILSGVTILEKFIK
jgi:hypothetical protein